MIQPKRYSCTKIMDFPFSQCLSRCWKDCDRMKLHRNIIRTTRLAIEMIYIKNVCKIFVLNLELPNFVRNTLTYCNIMWTLCWQRWAALIIYWTLDIFQQNQLAIVWTGYHPNCAINRPIQELRQISKNVKFQTQNKISHYALSMKKFRAYVGYKWQFRPIRYSVGARSTVT